MNKFERIILSVAIFLLVVYVILNIYTLSAKKKWNPPMKAFFFIIEFSCYFFIMLSIIYSISTYYKLVTNTKLLNDSLFSINTNQKVLTNIFDSLPTK